MKKYLTLFFIFFSINLAVGQEDEELPHSIIHFVRSGNFFGSACRTDITLPNQREFNLSLNSIVKYKLYSEGEVPITLGVLCPATSGSPASSASRQVILNVNRGNEYYIFYNAGSFDEVKKPEIQKHLDKIKNVMRQEENFDNPVNKSSLNNIAKREGKGQGTCFLISSEGYFITNYHCIENSKEITIRGIDNDFTTKFGATVIATDPSNDLALLKINNKNVRFTNPPFALRSSGVAQGEKVYAIGFPKAEIMGEETKITEGIISARSGIHGDVSKFQISAAVNLGNSGGPLIDEEGNLIGVIYAKSTVAESAGYAIKSSYLETFLKNVEGFNYPILINSFKDLSLSKKIEILNEFIFIIETN